MESFNYDLLEQQNNTMKKIFDSVGGYIKGEDLASLRLQVIKVCMEHRLFLRDIITGLVKSSLSESPDKPIDLDTAKNLFTVFFSDKLKLISKKSADGRNWETKVSPVSQQMVGMLWEQVFINCTYSSRKEYFDNIPAWDGQERIKTFMKEYFRCNSNPNFFLLLLTSIIGKIDDPEKNYCPFFFDFVSPSKGTGKTSFFQHLLGKHAINQAMKARRDDFYVDIYNANAFVVNDDECTWPGEGFDKISHDELKTIVTQHTDTFSRKYRQPETHARAFVIVRTSNEINQVFSTNERRQIIFEIGLEEKECLHWNCDDYFMQQLLAEAKAYYVEHGVYRMTDADWSDIDQQNKDNFETDGVSFRKFKQYIEFVRSHPNDETISTPATAIFKTHLPEDWRDYIWVTWSNYADWAELNNLKEILKPRVFWRQAEAGRNFFNWMYFKKGVKHTLKSTLRTQLIGIKKPSTKETKQETEPEKAVDLF